MNDVARRAGVSQPLVSQVIAGNPAVRVSAATRERILHAAAELGYQPNVLARGLVQSRSYSLGIIIPDLHNPFFTDVVSGAERVATQEGYAMLLCNAGDVAADRHVEALRARQIDGIIIDAVGAASLPAETLASLNVVLIDEPSTEHLAVTADAMAAGQMAAEHLLSLGHRQVGFLGPATDRWAIHMRERGFVRVLQAGGVRITSEYLRRAPATVEGGQVAMRALLTEPKRATAVFCANDLMAIGALKACVMARVAVPGAMSIVGCEDISTARLVTPELTTIHVPAREMGARAARLLIRQLRGELTPGDSRGGRSLEVRLVIRGTTGPPPSP
jgi:LacI family transcriptional regulator